MSISASPGSARAVRAVAGLIVVILTAVGLVTMPASSARAVTGTIDALGISVTGDGTAPGVDDTVDGNGIIGTNVAATFAWSITASNLVDGTISQTLPEGWTWSPARRPT
ncbi:hypothetical protein [Cellulomonas taurus]|uniref:hypothetical protein n=1 Tax=Cellulomonas taurus TaxID=2729175 RepID=UPI00145EFA91|nr:hypothetical protein [Cellulomonas taurus]